MERTPEVERLQEHGASVLCLDCPEGMLFGIDYSAWTIGPRFLGVKLIPPGLHFIYTSGSSEDVGVSRTGFFLHMKPREVAVFRWDPATEELARPENADEESRYADGVRGFDFDARLAPYPLDLMTQWFELTRHASAALVSKIEPVGKAIRSKRAEYDSVSAAVLAASQESEAEAMANNQDPVPMEDDQEVADTREQGQTGENGDDGMRGSSEPPPPKTEAQMESNTGGGTLFFSPVPRVRRARGVTPQETTSLHMDHSDQLEQLIAKEYGSDEMLVLGELQIAYIAFILGQNFDGFEQWRVLLQLLCGCEAIVLRRPGLYAELCRVFFAQLSQAPEDLFGDDLTKENFMGASALALLEICDANGLPPKLRKRCGKLRDLVQQKFGISVEDLALLGEDAPVIVDGEGRDLVSFDTPVFDGMD